MAAPSQPSQQPQQPPPQGPPHRDWRRTVVVAMDLQNTILEANLKEEGRIATFIERCNTVLDAARAADVPVVLVSVQFRPGYPEVSPCNKVFSAAAAAGRLQQQSTGAALHAQLHTVAARDIHVTKRRVGAFFGTDLQVVLSGLQTRHLVLLGVRTAGCVLSTVRHAADADFAISVVEDCCADADEEAHSVLLRKVFPWQAEVTTSTALVAALKDNASA